MSKAPPNAFADDSAIEGPTEMPLGDLDGDGIPEVRVSYPASYQERGQIVLKRLPAPTCFQVLYDGVGEGMALQKTKTKGFVDLLVLLIPITSHGRGSALVTATFQGNAYKLTRVDRCSDIEGKVLPRAECAGILKSYSGSAAP